MRHQAPRQQMGTLLGAATAAGLMACLAACAVAGSPGAQAPAGDASRLSAQATAAPERVFPPFDTSRPAVRFGEGLTRGLSAPVDFRAQMPPVRDQGNLYSCTAFALEGMAGYWERRKGFTEALSPGFVYVMAMHAEGQDPNDVRPPLATGVSVLQKVGIAPEARHPYLSAADQATASKVKTYLATLPSQDAMAAARPHRITSAAPIEDLESLKSALAKGKPVVFSIAIYPGFMTSEARSTGIIPLPDPAKEQRVGGHAIVAVGFDDAKQRLCFRNSWGADWGDKGYGYLPYGYFRYELARDAWVAN